MARFSVRRQRQLRRQRIVRLLNDGFTVAEAEFYAGFHWNISEQPFMRLRRARRREMAELRSRRPRWSNLRIRRFFERQWALTNESDLAAQLIDDKYQQINRRRMRQAA